MSTRLCCYGRLFLRRQLSDSCHRNAFSALLRVPSRRHCRHLTHNRIPKHTRIPGIYQYRYAALLQGVDPETRVTGYADDFVILTKVMKSVDAVSGLCADFVQSLREKLSSFLAFHITTVRMIRDVIYSFEDRHTRTNKVHEITVNSSTPSHVCTQVDDARIPVLKMQTASQTVVPSTSHAKTLNASDNGVSSTQLIPPTDSIDNTCVSDSEGNISSLSSHTNMCDDQIMHVSEICDPAENSVESLDIADSAMMLENKQRCTLVESHDQADKPIFVEVIPDSYKLKRQTLRKLVSTEFFQKCLENLTFIKDSDVVMIMKGKSKTNQQAAEDKSDITDDFPFQEFYTSSLIRLTSAGHDTIVCYGGLVQPQAAANRSTGMPPVTRHPVTQALDDMTYELARYASFGNLDERATSWMAPFTNANGWISRLAETGLYLTQLDNGVYIRCAFCDLVVSDSSRFERRSPRDVHRQLSPNCPLLTGEHTDNKPFSQPFQTTGQGYLSLMFEGLGRQQQQYTPKHQHIPTYGGSGGDREGPSDRYRLPEPSQRSKQQIAGASEAVVQQQFLSSTANVPVVSTVVSQAEASIAQTQSPVQSSQTSQTISAMTQNPSQNPDNPEASSAHAQGSYQSSDTSQASPLTPGSSADSASSQPEEARARNGENAPAPSTDPPRQVVTYSQLGIYTQQPKRPDMVLATTRSGTYSGWIHGQTHTPDEMAEAGFYYTGHNDLVRCFYCRGGLKSWAPHLRPWVEHARFFPKCPYVNQVKGRAYVDIVQELHEDQETVSEEQVEAELLRRSRRSFNQNTDETTVSSADVKDECGAVGGAVGGASVPVGEDTERLFTDEDDDDEVLDKQLEELEDFNRAAIEERMCKICQVSEVNILFLPCGHLVSCAHCAPALRTCAVCRQTVKGRVRVLMNEDEQ